MRPSSPFSPPPLSFALSPSNEPLNFAPLLFTETKQTNNRILLFFGKREKERPSEKEESSDSPKIIPHKHPCEEGDGKLRA
ncbi:hypothetical protein CDAR_117591 [Caerostris darwini]|uniref:Uncharacterized protein n=1 Tax=Caerostris darwini TaxID=1538125 RepID=A0AAV4WLX0_9ARAC|nr:hypothetical protein CDAR_117591 [Caerostris darwini]